MRADRLISILMLLQTRGKMTARSLAEALEVSERTIYRDIEALSASGVPVYAEYGPGGGLALVDHYRTNLTGLNESELRAIFMMLSAQGPLEKLGISRELKSGMLKLSAAVSGSGSLEEENVQKRFYLDWSWWFHTREAVPYLGVVQQAVWQDRNLRLRYRALFFMPVEVTVEPYGLVSKAGIWYLVGQVAGCMRVFRVSWLIDAALLDDQFRRKPGFNLAAFWQNWCAAYEANQMAYRVTLRVSPEAQPFMPMLFGQPVRELIAQAGPPDEQGWVILTLPFESLENARERILALGRSVEVLEPEALRASVIDFAEQIVNFYKG